MLLLLCKNVCLLGRDSTASDSLVVNDEVGDWMLGDEHTWW